MLASLEHDPKYRCRKVNKGFHTLEMRTNGTQHDIPNINHLGEKGRRRKGFRRVHNQREKLNPKPTDYNRLAQIHMLISLPFFLAPRKPCPSSMHPRSMCVHEKAKTRNQQTSNGKKKVQKAYGRGIKQTTVIDMASIETRM